MQYEMKAVYLYMYFALSFVSPAFMKVRIVLLKRFVFFESSII